MTRKRKIKEEVLETTMAKPEKPETTNCQSALISEDKIMSLDTDERNSLKDAECATADLLKQTYDSLIHLSSMRLKAKLSNTRVAGVAREIKELIKVMSVYHS